MKISIKTGRVVVTAVVMALAFPITAEAQLLKKLGKGLEKVNKGLEQVDKKLNANQKSNTKASDNTSASSPVINEQGWRRETNGTRYPYLTSKTKFMMAKPSEYSISGVYDGAFAVQRDNKWEFWLVDGRKLFDADWEFCNGGFGGIPKFSSGVVAVRRSSINTSGKKAICLLYLDGAVKELSPDYEMVTQFMDGVALVEAKINYKTQYFYINTMGERLYPGLSVGKDGNSPMRPLTNGLRGYYDSTARKWGFIDQDGKVKIQPKYSDVTAFSEGYAWGTVSDIPGYKELIDVTGKGLFRTDDSYAKVSDVVNGRFYVKKGNLVVYYDVNTLNELASFTYGNCFYGGYAFAYNDAFRHDYCSLIDKDMREVRKVSGNVVTPSVISEFGPNFEPYGLASVRHSMGHMDYVITPKGEVVLHGYDNMKGTCIRGFSQFTADGYMQATNVNLKGKRALALVKPSGEIAWLFSEDKEVGGPWEQNPLPDPEIPGINDPLPPLPEPGGPAIGPKTVTRTTFAVNVIASPAEGGSVSVSPSGKFNYGENAVVSATPNKDWAVGSVTTNIADKSAPQIGKPFSVTTDQTVTVHFIEKEDEKAPDNFGIYQGTVYVIGNPVTCYAEINQKEVAENPYGSDNYGFVALMFDPDKRYYTPEQEAAVNFFAAPLKIVGIQTDKDNPEKRWLVMDGAATTVKDLKINPLSNNPFAHLWFNFCLEFDGFSTVNIIPRRYRVEMLDFNDETGEFKFGVLQTYSPDAGGYVYGDDESLEKTSQGFFVDVTDRGYPSDTFSGAVMKQAQKRNDVQWYPPESWSKDKSAYETLLEMMREGYRTAKSNYEQLFGN